LLPGRDGDRGWRAIREGGSQVPVLILTARGEEADKVTGFRLGADDYVTKPFGVLELVARGEGVLRGAPASWGACPRRRVRRRLRLTRRGSVTSRSSRFRASCGRMAGRWSSRPRSTSF